MVSEQIDLKDASTIRSISRSPESFSKAATGMSSIGMDCEDCETYPNLPSTDSIHDRVS